MTSLLQIRNSAHVYNSSKLQAIAISVLLLSVASYVIVYRYHHQPVEKAPLVPKITEPIKANVTIPTKVDKPIESAIKSQNKFATKPVKLTNQILPEILTGKPKIPAMPLAPRHSGPLTGLSVIIDPGHGGSDSGAIWQEEFGKQTVTFYEASYNYRLAWQMAELIRYHGGNVWLTAVSQVMSTESDNAQTPLPKPTDAIYVVDGRRVSAQNLSPRTEIIRRVLDDYQYHWEIRGVIFISLHINSATGRDGEKKDNARGSFVVVEDPLEVPRLAHNLADSLDSAGYLRLVKNRRGQWRQVNNIVEQRCRLWVLSGTHNRLRQRVLIELAEPGASGDSWRMRNQSSRRKLLETVIIPALEKYLKDTPKRLPDIKKKRK